jgi:hypothetical protein
LTVAALDNKDVNLYSDLAIHDMGTGLADGISQDRRREENFGALLYGAWGSDYSSFMTVVSSFMTVVPRIWFRRSENTGARARRRTES